MLLPPVGDCGVEGNLVGVGALTNVASLLGWDVDTSTRGSSTDDMMEFYDILQLLKPRYMSNILKFKYMKFKNSLDRC